MSLNDIVNYVRTTPGNTNPSVVRSMVEGQIGEYVEEASNKALRKLGIRESTDWKTIFDANGYPIPFEENGGIYNFVQTYEGEHPLETIKDGDVCKVVFDGVEYICTAANDGGVIEFGSKNHGEDGVPFSFELWLDTIREVDIYAWNSTEPTHTVHIYTQTETITPISDKYLPEGKVGRSEWEVVFNHTYRFIGGGAMIGDLDGDGITDGFPLVVGKRYMITFDGVDYEYTCELIPGGTVLYIGSLEFLESGVVGEGQAPVVFMDTSSLPQPGGTFIYTADKTPTQHTVKVAVEKVTPIDPKYLPAGISQSVILEIPYTAMNQLTLGNTIPLDATMAEQIERAGFENRPLYVRAAVTFGEATGFQQIKFDCSVIQSIENNEQVVMTFVGSIGPIHGRAQGICVTYIREGETAALESKIAEQL